jgi:hypothetical protein
MDPPKNKKKKPTNKGNETIANQPKTSAKEEHIKEKETAGEKDPDAAQYFNAQDEDQDLRTDDVKDLPM